MARLAALVVTTLLVGCGVSGTCGCDDSCAATRSCTTGSAGTAGGSGTSTGSSCPDDPADGDVDGTCGVWVSAILGDDTNPGTQDAPVRTLQRGVDLAPGGHVYACAETYFEEVRLPAGTSLHGGWFCQNGWKQTDKRATIAPVHDVIPLRLIKGDGTSLVTDIVARAADAANPGGSSIATWADDGADVELRRVELRAGDGAPGANGEHGGLQPATSGTAGFGGNAACTAPIGEGGLPPATACDDGTSVGGEGGDGSEAAAQPGGEGTPNYGAGKGGLGEEASPVCTAGTDGAAGISGLDGAGAAAGGNLTLEGFVGPAGSPGTPGKVAQGGGGGGASYGNAGCGLAPHGGAGGGSGGAGGCGGKPGAGGQGGGASIAIASRSSNVRLVDARLVAAGGGKGGNGGSAQVGGLGGLPGIGGAAYSGQTPVHGGCSGGFGGKGGTGGNAGGGAGGPSAAIAHVFGRAPATEDVDLLIGDGGTGGLGGNPAEPSGTGAMGESTKVIELGS